MAEFTNPKGPFVEGEKYIFVLNLKGSMLAHGVNEKYIGHDFIDVKDYDGRSYLYRRYYTMNSAIHRKPPAIPPRLTVGRHIYFNL